MLTVPDAFSHYSFDSSKILSTRCLEVVGEIKEVEWGIEAMIEAQIEEWGYIEENSSSETNLFVNEESILVIVTKK